MSNQATSNQTVSNQTILAFNEARERKPYRQKFADYYSQPYVAAAEDWLKAQGFLTKQK